MLEKLFKLNLFSKSEFTVLEEAGALLVKSPIPLILEQYHLLLSQDKAQKERQI